MFAFADMVRYGKVMYVNLKLRAFSQCMWSADPKNDSCIFRLAL